MSSLLALLPLSFGCYASCLAVCSQLARRYSLMASRVSYPYNRRKPNNIYLHKIQKYIYIFNKYFPSNRFLPFIWTRDLSTKVPFLFFSVRSPSLPFPLRNFKKAVLVRDSLGGEDILCFLLHFCTVIGFHQIFKSR